MKNKILLGILSVLLVIGLTACNEQPSKQLPMNQGTENQNTNNQVENENFEEDEYFGESGNEEFDFDWSGDFTDISGNQISDVKNEEIKLEDFPENPVDAVGNLISFNSNLEPETIGLGSYKMTADGSKIIDKDINKEIKTKGIAGKVNTFICDGNDASISNIFNFIVLNENGEIYGACLTSSDASEVTFKKIELSEKIKEMGIARGQEERDGNIILKTESGALKIVYCFPEEDGFSADIINFVPQSELENIEEIEEVE